jgi:hypothetical protein
MAEGTQRELSDLTIEELEAQEAVELPDREAMSLVNLQPDPLINPQLDPAPDAVDAGAEESRGGVIDPPGPYPDPPARE